MGGIYGCVHIRGGRNGECLALACWLGSDQWQLGLESLTSKARAHCHLLHSSAELSPPPPVQALTLKYHCPEQNVKLLPNNSLLNHLLFKVYSKSKSGRGTGEKTRGQEEVSVCCHVREGKGSQRGELLRGCVCVIITLSTSGRQRRAVCSSLTMVMKSPSWRSSSLVLHRDRGWYCKRNREKVIISQGQQDRSISRSLGVLNLTPLSLVKWAERITTRRGFIHLVSA